MIEGLVAIAAFVLLAQRPLLAVIVLLVVVGSVFGYGILPRASLPGHPPVNVGDVCLAAAITGTLWRRPWRTWPTAGRRYFLALITFFVVACIATVKTSLLGYTESRAALVYYINWLYLGAALTVALELSGRRWRPFLNFAVGLAALIACLSVAGAISSGVAQLLNTLAPTEGTVVAAGASEARVHLVGVYFVYSMCIPTLVMVLLVKDRWRWLRAGALLLMLAAIGVSFNRNMYIGLLIALLLTALLGGAKIRARVAVGAAVTIIALVLLVVASAAPGIASSVGQRAATALSPAALLHSSDAQDRLYEMHYALPEIARHPWFGIGPSQFYGAFVASPGGVVSPRDFIQNIYVDIATDYGIPAAVAFLLIPAVCLMFGVARLPYAVDPFDRAFLAGAIATMVALLLTLLVGVYLQSPESTVAFGVSCGVLLAAALRTCRSSQRTDWKSDVRPA